MDLAIYLIESLAAHQNVFVVWKSRFPIILNDGDGFSNRNDNANRVFVAWDRLVIEVQPPALNAFSLVYWRQALYWIVETEDVRFHNLDTDINIRYVISPNMLFNNDDDPHSPRAFLAVQDDVILYISAPINEVDGELERNIRVGELLFVEDDIASVRRCLPSTLYIQDGAIFLNRGQ